jgi:hypothetical protein
MLFDKFSENMRWNAYFPHHKIIITISYELEYTIFLFFDTSPIPNIYDIITR